MQRKWFILLFIFALVTLSCGFFGQEKDDNEALPDAPSAVDAPQAEVQHSGPAAEQQSAEQPAPEMEAPAPSFASDAPQFFIDEFDGETADPNWFDEYSYWVDEDVEEDDDEYTPSYSIEQRRGALRFEIDSPFLYLYHIYQPHQYDDVRIDFEIENKGVNTNNVGAICRYTDYGWYEFITTSGGYYSIMRYYEDGNKELATGGIKSIRFGTDKKERIHFHLPGQEPHPGRQRRRNRQSQG